MTQLPWKEYLNNAGGDGRNDVPDGWYDVVVHAAKAAKTGAGKAKINVRFTVESGPYGGSAIFNDFVISPESPVALRIFFDHMGVLGVPKTEIDRDLPELEDLAQRVADRKARARLQLLTTVRNERERQDMKSLRRQFGEDAPAATQQYGSSAPSADVSLSAPESEAGPSMPVIEPPMIEFPDNEVPPTPPF